ncbi:hypothetical protein CEY16_13340 [Halalkalibacillus sediminis]|uniref:Sporulation protein Cse60 n=1 Tax=Halalkalibacillus sediminis TaxID=2018042 RepID=A0A2I0QR46_9BACI|nr:sporulation protein Cse60 [Halalkalibacillus sediminis]PKR76798.1 hypothetical protein CEY16_13340 [Halalkalibacillus sediminis]
MKVKTFSAASEKGIDNKLNEFLDENNHSIEIVDIKFSYGAMVVFKEKHTDSIDE